MRQVLHNLPRSNKMFIDIRDPSRAPSSDLVPTLNYIEETISFFGKYINLELGVVSKGVRKGKMFKAEKTWAND